MDEQSALPGPMNEKRKRSGKKQFEQYLNNEKDVPFYYPIRARVTMSDGTESTVERTSDLLLRTTGDLNRVCRELVRGNGFTHVGLEMLVCATDEMPKHLVTYVHRIGDVLKSFVLPIESVRIIRKYRKPPPLPPKVAP